MPGTYFGPFNEQYSDYAHGGNANLGRFPLGHTLILPDGREYKFTLNDATVEVAGNLYQSVVPVNFSVTCDVARAAAATAISGTLTASAAAVDIYSEGTVHVSNGTGEGYSHRIKRAMSVGEAHAAAASTGVLTVNLEAGEGVQVATNVSTSVTFTRNRYHAALIHASPPTAAVVGVSPGTAAASRFYWSQTKGYAAVLAEIGNLYRGNPVQAGTTTDGTIESHKRRVRSTGTTVAFTTATITTGVALSDSDGGAVGIYSLNSVVSAAVAATYDITGGVAYNSPIVGICVQSMGSTEYALIDLNIV